LGSKIDHVDHIYVLRAILGFVNEVTGEIATLHAAEIKDAGEVARHGSGEFVVLLVL